jgi:ankyrin repeat protein
MMLRFRMGKIFARGGLAVYLAVAVSVVFGSPTGDAIGIVDAAKANSGATVRLLVEQGADVTTAASDGATSLHWAAHWDDLESAVALVAAGADVNARNRYGAAPITLAATNGNTPMVELLIKAGADPNTAVGDGETVLMTAARTGRRDLVETLVLHGADVNAQEGWRGQTALMWAAGEGHVGAVEALIEAGAKIDSRSEGGFSPYLFAVRQGHIGVVGVLLAAGADINETLPGRNRNRYGAEIGGRNKAVGSSALNLAVANAHYELAGLLLDKGADPNAAGVGWSPLHTISWVREPGKGSNDPAPDGSGSMDSLSLVRKLVAHGADVNARMTKRSRAGRHSLDTVGATPFVSAARTADVELMQLLIELGADPLIPTEAGTTSLMVAAGLGTRAPDEDAGTPETVVEAVKLVLSLGVDPNIVNKNGDTAMHGAAYKHVAGAVPLLVAGGAEIENWNTKNQLGWTPLRIATGVHRGMNLRASPETAAAIREVMEAANVSTVVEPEGVISGETK